MVIKNVFVNPKNEISISRKDIRICTIYAYLYNAYSPACFCESFLKSFSPNWLSQYKAPFEFFLRVLVISRIHILVEFKLVNLRVSSTSSVRLIFSVHVGFYCIFSLMAIGTASANFGNSVESEFGCTSGIYFDNVTPTSQKRCQHNNKCDCSKTNVYKWSL